MNKSHKLKGGQAAVQALKKEKTKHVFGLIGSATMEMFDALYHEKDIKNILRNRVEVLLLENKDLSSFKKLSNVPLFNAFNKKLAKFLLY